MGYPTTRLRRFRKNRSRRRIFDAPWPAPQKFLWPVFVVPGDDRREPIEAMPGQFRLSIDHLKRETEAALEQGIGGLLIFGIPGEGEKDAAGHAAHSESGIVPQSVRALKESFPELPIFTDVCLCAYTTHGHCAPLDSRGHADNDAALPILAETALAHARAGADGVAPSAMMDGQVQAIRRSLDENGYDDTILMSYSTKFASSLYGPFRIAEDSAPGHGDRRGYQQSFRNLNQSVWESREDEDEGADILMVKPGLWYLDVIRRIKEETLRPLAAYNVSGEYSMIHAAAERGWGDLDEMAAESLFAFERAGVDIIISYWARYYDRIFAGRPS